MLKIKLVASPKKKTSTNKKSKKPTSPLKPAKSLASSMSKLKNSIDDGIQSLNVTKLEQTLSTVVLSLQSIDSSLTGSSTDIAALSKNHVKTEKSLLKIVEQIKNYQEWFPTHERNLVDDVIPKISTLKSPDIQDTTFEKYKNSIGTDLKEIKELLETGKKNLKTLADKAEKALKLNHELKPKINKLALPEHVAQCGKQATKLKNLTETICNTTKLMTKQDAPSSEVIDNLKKELPQLLDTIAIISGFITQCGINLKEFSANQNTQTTSSQSLQSIINNLSLSSSNASNFSSTASSLLSSNSSSNSSSSSSANESSFSSSSSSNPPILLSTSTTSTKKLSNNV